MNWLLAFILSALASLLEGLAWIMVRLTPARAPAGVGIQQPQSMEARRQALLVLAEVVRAHPEECPCEPCATFLVEGSRWLHAEEAVRGELGP